MKRIAIAVLLLAVLGLTACAEATLRAGEFKTQKWWADKDRERS